VVVQRDVEHQLVCLANLLQVLLEAILGAAQATGQWGLLAIEQLVAFLARGQYQHLEDFQLGLLEVEQLVAFLARGQYQHLEDFQLGLQEVEQLVVFLAKDQCPHLEDFQLGFQVADQGADKGSQV